MLHIEVLQDSDKSPNICAIVLKEFSLVFVSLPSSKF